MQDIVKLCSWNVNGIRAAAKKNFFTWLMDSGFDVVSLQETKISLDQIDERFKNIISYPFVEFNSAERKGYSGVANYISERLCPTKFNLGFDVKKFTQTSLNIVNIDSDKIQTSIEFDGIAAINPGKLYQNGNQEILAEISRAKKLSKTDFEDKILKFNNEGRVIETHHRYKDLSFILLNIYFPNGGASTERLKFKLEFYEAFLIYVSELLKENPNIIITGDYNTAHYEIDLARPKENTNTSGFMAIERIYLDRFETLGFVDSFRYLHPEKADSYTWWSFRTAARVRNVGWRIDYFYISKALVPYLSAANIHDDILGSDHCPVSIELQVS